MSRVRHSARCGTTADIFTSAIRSGTDSTRQLRRIGWIDVRKLPVAIACQPRSIKAEHGADFPDAQGGDKLLEAGPDHHAAARAAEIVVDHIHGPETTTTRDLDQFILASPALGVELHLGRGRLAHMDHRLALQDGRRKEITVHHRFAPTCPLPSIEIRVPLRFSRSVHANDVNCEPWSVFMIPGGPKRWVDSFSASTQKSASSVFEMRQASTLRVNQSMIATR
jgi:hypothetical protein